MQAGGVTTTDAYDVSGRVLIDGQDIGADVETISLGRDIPSGLPGDSGFTSASGSVTAVWGDDVSDRVDHPWSPNPVWPPEPNATVEVRLSDGTREWTQFKGVITDPSGSTSTRTISFGVRDNYRSLDRLITIPALSDRMPALVDANYYRYIGMNSCWLTDRLLRAGGRYATPPRAPGDVVGATMLGSTWPERGVITQSQKDTPDGGTVMYPNWVNTRYGLAVQNVTAEYEPSVWSGTPGGGRLHNRPVELTQEVLPDSGEPTYLRARFWGGGRVALIQYDTAIRLSYYNPSGTPTTLLQVPSAGKVRATAWFSMTGTTLTAELRTQSSDGTINQEGTATHNVGDALNGPIEHVWAHGEGAQGAFQVAFPPVGREWETLDFTPNAVLHIAGGGRNWLTGVPPQINQNVLDLLNAQADAEFAQWWIDEHDVLQWWDRGLLAQQPVRGVLTGADHVKELSWSHDHDSARHQVHVQYQHAEVNQRWRTNLTLWEGNGDTLEQGDEAEIFVNVPNDEIWLGVDTENPTNYGRTVSSYWAINRGIRTVTGGIAVDSDGNERPTNSIVTTVRKVTDETYVFEHNITALSSDEQAVLEFPSERAVDSALWARWLGKGLPILRGKMRIRFQDETATSDITGSARTPDYTHTTDWWVQGRTYAGLTADYAAASLTQTRPKITGLDIMPVFALQAGDRVVVQMPEVMGLQIDAVVTSINTDADLAAGTASQSISLLPISFCRLGGTWQHFGQTSEGQAWTDFAALHAGDTWDDFGSEWEGCDPPAISPGHRVSWSQFGDSDPGDWKQFGADRDRDTWHGFGSNPLNN